MKHIQSAEDMNPRHAILTFTLLASLALNAAATTRYVDLNSPGPTPPYTNWLTAATNIQDAVDAAEAGDTVLVTNGVYKLGGTKVAGSDVTNRVVITNAVMVASVNGPAFTVIEGSKAPSPNTIRCVWLGGAAKILGFTLTNGGAGFGNYGFGGGVFCNSSEETVSNCILTGNDGGNGGGGSHRGTLQNCVIVANSAGGGGGAYRSVLENCVVSSNTAIGAGGGVCYSTLSNSIVTGNVARSGGGGYYSDMVGCKIGENRAMGTGSSTFNGGGVYAGKLSNCQITGNSAISFGGGAFSANLTNCAIAGNSAGHSGGAYPGSVQNCIIYYNTATLENPNYGGIGAYSINTCTIPLSAGSGNITNAPLFVDTNGWADLRLQSSSPCINAGNNAFVASATDLDGNPRIVGGTVDIGAYEFQSPTSVLSYAWAQQNGLPTDGSADFTDADGDGANNWHEWRADTGPTNAASALLMGTATNGVTGLVVSWASVATRSYWLERAGDFGALPPFQTIATNLPGTAGTKTYNDTSATNGGPYFYRVGVQ